MNPSISSSALALLLALSAPAQALVLAPQYEGVFLDGDGANSRWVQVRSNWRGGIHGDETWGTGIWGLADHAEVMALSTDHRKVLRTLETRVAQIDFADRRFINRWGATWGTPELAPLFSGTGPTRGGQDNWASSFWGYLAIPTAGEYNFGVLFDDGFRFTLMGADGAGKILMDGLNPRDRLGFAENLSLLPGLYGFQLDAYERLEAGVVQLGWYTPGASDWAVVPTSQLYTAPPRPSLAANAIPEPAVPMLMLAGLAALGLGRLRR